AVKFHEKAVELAPNEKDIVTGLYYALKEVGSVDKLCERFKELSEKYPTHDWIRMSLANSYFYKDPPKFYEAMNEYNTLLEQPQNLVNTTLLVNKTWCQFMLGIKLKSAEIIEKFKESLNLLAEEDLIISYREVAEVLLVFGDTKEAREFLQKGQEIESSGRWSLIDPILLAAFALKDQDTKRLKDAIVQFLLAVESVPEKSLESRNWSWTELRWWLDKTDYEEKSILNMALNVFEGKEPLEKLRSELDNLK
ncbi:MAG: hypothetical protein GY845_28755, partial [Planctomycetes bacterium]|nr:hypothetical protein [Planctomycetota bacterium]